MSSLSSENTRLIVTAVGAAITGAAIAVTFLSWRDKRDRAIEKTFRDNINNRPSVIYLDESGRATADELAAVARSRSSNTTVLFPHNHEEKMRRQIAARAAVEEENTMPRRSVTVRVPATSANMGPGCKWFLINVMIYYHLKSPLF